MKKRVISLLLCLMMVLSVFLTGCGKDSEDAKGKIDVEGSKGNVTLSMWIVTEEAVTEENAAAYNAVTAKLNDLIETNLKTRLHINFLTADEYEAKVSEAITNYKGGTSTDTETTPAEGEDATTEAQENTGFKPIFPALLENQVDIIYIEGKEMYTNFRNNDWLAPLDELISTNSANKPLKEYISNVVLNGAKENGKTYAIPNNNTVGDYTYMLLNKEMMDAYGYAELAKNGKINSFYSEYVYGYLDAVAKHAAEKGTSGDIVMIDGSYEELLDQLAYFWNVNGSDLSLLNEFSLFGKTYGDPESLNRGSIELGYGNLFADKTFAENYLKLNRFEMDGYFGDAEAAGKDAAITFVTCDLIDLEQYTDDYYPVIVKYPTFAEADLYDNGMFAVCSKSDKTRQTRSMEIITYLNTNAEFRNTLYYGVEGVHYEKQQHKIDDVIYTVAYKLNNDYTMSLGKTGNVVLVYPTVDPENPANDMPLDVWEYVKNQNFEAKIDPMLGFDLNTYADKIDADLLAYMNSLNADLLALIDTVRTEKGYDGLAALVGEIAILLDATSEATAEDFVELKAYIEDTEKTVANDLVTLRENLAKATDSKAASGSVYSAYATWLSAYGYNVKK